ncbi:MULTISPECIES: 3-dehydroquinate synthase [unclassified Clostridium]|uniref:3-dehydroquinate synthase n=1 Tax=unclassified Clostridium TaxID=2614128 RepID=UPI000E51CB62|nr:MULTISPECIES: 3-dehydroquinate synthase [unclassified Clostridium]RHS84370.1 3-dehydroquinate synthase [Clostridium sp. AM42-4]RHV86349.1 3-dehydroquinate synthase [Clostridium sp. OF09-36]HBM48253.1 3-dehydroquinate synthase [Lachnoclostridium sp.]
MSDRMTVHRDGKPIYDIVMEENYDKLGKEVAALSVQERRLCVVTDSTVAELYSETVIRQLEPVCKEVHLFVFEAGEKNKNLDTVRKLYEFLIQNHYDRNDMLVALGGGVVGDLCGFTAATYLRGIRFIQVPTTLLSQVDSSIGGKTGVDFDAYKNMVGAFHMPQLVYTAAASLLTLTEEQFACGMGEVIKHGLIMDAGYYEWLQEHREEILARDLSICEQMILISCRIKRDVVEQDPTEQGIRGILNFGHTLGHAIEKLMDFKLLHGQCVALGSIAAAYLSAGRGEITMDEAVQIRNVFEEFGLPVSIKDFGLAKEAVIAATKNDKKMDSGKIKFILLHRIGEAFIDRTVTDEQMEQSLDLLMGGAL